MDRWYRLVGDYLSAQAKALAGVLMSRGNLCAEPEPMETPGATVPCDSGHRHYDRQHARMCNEIDAHACGFYPTVELAVTFGDDE